MEIIYHDKYIAVCVKPAGALSEGAADDEKTVPSMLAAELRALGETVNSVYPVHRLDRETSGLMVYALTQKAAAALSSAVAEHKMQKKYIATVHGKPEPEVGEMKDFIYYDRNKGKSFTVKKERKGVKDASLAYEMLEYDAEARLSRVKITLHTGRTHQIRVQFASRKMPLFGDRKYGAPQKDGNALALTSVYLAFPHPKGGEILEFEI